MSVTPGSLMVPGVSGRSELCGLSLHRYQPSSAAIAATALSDTEVEIKDRLSSKLWEWSAGSPRLTSTEVYTYM